MRGWNRFWGMALILAGYAILVSLLPAGSALEFSSDEGYELIKAFLVTKGHRLYTEIWSDQPPLLTHLLAWVITAFDNGILAPRLFVAFLGLVMLLLFYDLVRETAGDWGALVAVFLLCCSPGTLLLSVAAMQEVPSMALSLCALWLSVRGAEQNSRTLLFLAGAVFAAAIQVKLTAALFLPAILAAWWQKHPPGLRTALTRFALHFGTALTLVTVIAGVWLGKGSMSSSWLAHTAASPSGYTIDYRLFTMHWESIAAAVLALIIAARTRAWTQIAIPCLLLATDSLAHLVHRPWWNYYYLHIAVPICWLAGWSAARLLAAAGLWRPPGNTGPTVTGPFRLRLLQAMVCLGLALVLARSERRLEAYVQDLRSRERIKDNSVLRAMSAYAQGTPLVFAEAPIYAFHAGLQVPPDLAAITLKRVWSGQLTPEQVLQRTKETDPELILLRKRTVSALWLEFLDGNYHKAASDASCDLFVTKRLLPLQSGAAPPAERKAADRDHQVLLAEAELAEFQNHVQSCFITLGSKPSWQHNGRSRIPDENELRGESEELQSRAWRTGTAVRASCWDVW